VTSPGSRRSRFALVGVSVTAIDVGLLVALVRGPGWNIVAADAAAVGVAATASLLLHRRISFGAEPRLRWVRQPGSVATISVLTGGVDVLLTSVLATLASAGAIEIPVLLGAKAVGVGVAAVFRGLAYRSLLLTLVTADHSQPARRPEPAGVLRLSVVIPAFRAVGEIGRTVERIATELEDIAAGGGLEIIVVDDGSGDGTATEATEAGADHVIIQPENRGKGAAVRAGVVAAAGRTIVFTDADLSYSPDQIRGVLAEIEDGWDVVVGSRHHTDATALVRARRLRELSGRVFNRVTSWVLLGGYRDTQCGLKGFRSDVARCVFAQARVDGFAFDVEIFHLVERMRLALREIPVTLDSAEASTVRMSRHAPAMVRDVLRIRRWAAQGAYRVDASALPPPGRVRR